VRIDNDLLAWASVSDPPGDRVNPLPPALRRGRNLGELDRGARAGFLGVTPMQRKAKSQNQTKRSREPFPDEV